MARDEFPSAVKDAVAKRASYVCSNPECRALTVAPSDADASKVLYIGKVAHMSAAAPGGPRYDSSMIAEDRIAISNALFLCSNCAELIDRNGGADYPISRLKAWKQQHEEWVRSNLNRRADSPLSVVDGTHEAVGVGEVTALDIQEAAIIKPGTVSKATGQGKVTATRIGRPPKE